MRAKSRKSSNGRTRYAGIGFELAAAVGGFAAVGYWIGSHYGNARMGLLVGAVLGIVGGMYNLIRAAVAVSRNATEKQRDQAQRENG